RQTRTPFRSSEAAPASRLLRLSGGPGGRRRSSFLPSQLGDHGRRKLPAEAGEAAASPAGERLPRPFLGGCDGIEQGRAAPAKRGANRGRVPTQLPARGAAP